MKGTRESQYSKFNEKNFYWSKKKKIEKVSTNFEFKIRIISLKTDNQMS